MKHSVIHLLKHLVLALLIGILGWWITKSFRLGLFGGLVNFFMDTDHLFEYLWWKKDRFSLRDFLTGVHFEQKGKIYVLFHGWEYVLVSLTVFGWSGNKFWLVLAIALGSHLIFDQFSWPNHPLSYFLTYRAKNGFRLEKVCLR